ncbi:MAG: aromatic ring-hydroxylating dioxygenase subunit alpha [Porticoccaceae bacterium]|nr:aromatic ring-hydroxylating dioxygenase subunit alpha [Porticoccaceae bacterium]
MNELEELKTITQQTLQLRSRDNFAVGAVPTRPPRWAYADKNLFDLEKSELFGRRPLLVGFSCDIPKPGDFFTFDDLQVPVLITRDKQGNANAMLNICSHRAARLKEGNGNARSISCPYHAWNFGLDGKLKKIFKEDSFGEVDKCDYDLQTLPCAEKYGLLFISLDADAELDIDQHLGDLAPWFEMWDLMQMDFIDQYQWQAKGNWKHALDTLFKDYRGMASANTTNTDRVLETVADDERFGPDQQHHRLTFANNALLELRDSDPGTWIAKQLHSVQRVHFLFPNISLLISQTAVELFVLYPGEEPGRHSTRYRAYRRTDTKTIASSEQAQTHFETMRDLIEENNQPLADGHEHSARDDTDQTPSAVMNMQRSCLVAVGIDPDSPARPN